MKKTSPPLAVQLQKGMTLNWDNHFCHVSAGIQEKFPTGSALDRDYQVVVEYTEEGQLLIPRDIFGFIITLLVSRQPEGQAGFLVTDPCTVPFDGKMYRIGYSNDSTESVGWYLSDS